MRGWFGGRGEVQCVRCVRCVPYSPGVHDRDGQDVFLGQALAVGGHPGKGEREGRGGGRREVEGGGPSLPPFPSLSLSLSRAPTTARSQISRPPPPPTPRTRPRPGGCACPAGHWSRTWPGAVGRRRDVRDQNKSQSVGSSVVRGVPARAGGERACGGRSPQNPSPPGRGPFDQLATRVVGCGSEASGRRGMERRRGGKRSGTARPLFYRGALSIKQNARPWGEDGHKRAHPPPGEPSCISPEVLVGCERVEKERGCVGRGSRGGASERGGRPIGKWVTGRGPSGPAAERACCPGFGSLSHSLVDSAACGRRPPHCPPRHPTQSPWHPPQPPSTPAHRAPLPLVQPSARARPPWPAAASAGDLRPGLPAGHRVDGLGGELAVVALGAAERHVHVDVPHRARERRAQHGAGNILRRSPAHRVGTQKKKLPSHSSSSTPPLRSITSRDAALGTSQSTRAGSMPSSAASGSAAASMAVA